MKTLYPTLLAAPAMAFAAVPLHGAVVLQDSYAAGASSGASSDLGGGVFGYEFTLDPNTEFSAAGHDKLILSFSSHDGNSAGGNIITSITYDGAPLTEAVFDVDNGQIVTAGIYYLDNVATDGTLRIEFALNNLVHFGFGLYAVDGLKPGVQDTGTGRTTTEIATNVPVTITTNEGFVVQEATRNNQSLSGDPLDGYDTLYNYNLDSYRGLQQYRLTTAPNDYAAPIGNGGQNFRRVITAGFEAVPEPSSLALVSLGGLLIARRRR